MMLAIALLLAGKEALPHVNDLHVHLVAHVHLLGHVHDVSFVEFLHPGRVPGMLVLVARILHVSVLGDNDGLNEVNQ